MSWPNLLLGFACGTGFMLALALAGAASKPVPLPVPLYRGITPRPPLSPPKEFVPSATMIHPRTIRWRSAATGGLKERTFATQAELAAFLAELLDPQWGVTPSWLTINRDELSGR